MIWAHWSTRSNGDYERTTGPDIREAIKRHRETLAWWLVFVLAAGYLLARTVPDLLRAVGV